MAGQTAPTVKKTGSLEGAWPARQVERWSVKDLKPFPRNARLHSPDQVREIARSIEQWGWTMPVLVDEHGGIIAGHARTEAAKLLGLVEVPVIVARGWTETQKRAYVLADNKLAENATWDDKMLAMEVADLKQLGFDMALAGFSTTDLASLDELLSEEEQAELVRSNGSLLALVDITVREPKHEVHYGDTWHLGRHVLHCCSVITGWPQWVGDLEVGAVFCPFPGVFVPLSDKAAEHRLVMVQPDPYVAGHILDRYCEVHGESEVRRAGLVAA